MADAVRECQAAQSEAFREAWTHPEVVSLFASLPDDALTLTIAERAATLVGGRGSILVVGGATGRLGRQIATTNPEIEVTEIDASSQMVKVANSLGDSLSNFRSVEGNAFHMTFASNSFDLVVAQGFLRHFPDTEIQRLTQEMTRVGNKTLLAEANSGRHALNVSSASFNHPITELPMKMLRLSLTLHLYEQLKIHADFRQHVEQQSGKQSVMDYLLKLAGEEDGTLHLCEF